MAVLTNLNLSDNDLCGLWWEGGKRTGLYTATGIEAIAAALRGSAVLTSLNLSGNHIGPAGAIPLAEALMGNAMLTECNVLRNELDVNSATMLARIGT